MTYCQTDITDIGQRRRERDRETTFLLRFILCFILVQGIFDLFYLRIYTLQLAVSTRCFFYTNDIIIITVRKIV